MATELPPGLTREGAASRRLSDETHAETCYFRSGPPNGQRKVLLQITERCDLRCSHCFVSATGTGSDMDIEEIRRVIPKLKDAKVANVTLTGGEPLVHPDFVKIVSELVAYDFDVTVCSNGASLTVELAKTMRDLGRVRFNLSLDGFSEASHGRFRGDRSSFERTIQSAKDLAALEILKGLLCNDCIHMSKEFLESLLL